MMNDWYFRVDGLSTSVCADSYESALSLVREKHPDADIEFVRVCGMHDPYGKDCGI